LDVKVKVREIVEEYVRAEAEGREPRVKPVGVLSVLAGDEAPWVRLITDILAEKEPLVKLVDNRESVNYKAWLIEPYLVVQTWTPLHGDDTVALFILD